MIDESTDRESVRVAELVREYRKKGYSVVTPRNTSDVPAFLRIVGYVPDLIAKSAKGNLVVEVKSRQTASGLKEISKVADLVNSRRGWEFVLVFTNPKHSGWSDYIGSRSDAWVMLRKTEAFDLHEEAHREAAFLFAWAALEQSLRAALLEGAAKTRATSPKALVRNAAMHGIIGRQDAHYLDRLLDVRNGLVHGISPLRLEASDVHRLRKLVEEIATTDWNRDV